MPRLKNLTNGAQTSTGTVTLEKESRTIGGILLNANGTDLAQVELRKTDASGEIIFDMNSVSTVFVGIPLEAADVVYYSVTGTGASIELFEWKGYKGRHS